MESSNKLFAPERYDLQKNPDSATIPEEDLENLYEAYKR